MLGSARLLVVTAHLFIFLPELQDIDKLILGFNFLCDGLTQLGVLLDLLLPWTYYLAGL